jgi:hypothetical protein
VLLPICLSTGADTESINESDVITVKDTSEYARSRLNEKSQIGTTAANTNVDMFCKGDLRGNFAFSF